MIIERRGRSHKAVCSCSWASHSWNELRPAEADAWHHVFGDEVIVDVAAIPDERSVAAAAARPGPGPGIDVREDHERDLAQLVQHARDYASRPSPYTRDAAPELWRLSGESRVLVQSAVTELEELLERHDRQSARAADSEWLQLITAKRLLIDSLAHEAADRSHAGSGRRALI